jgi:hypothetical protein
MTVIDRPTTRQLARLWAFIEGVHELESSAFSPLLASPQGGVAKRSRNIAKHPLIAKPGWFSDENKKVNHPGCVQFGGYAKFS